MLELRSGVSTKEARNAACTLMEAVTAKREGRLVAADAKLKERGRNKSCCELFLIARATKHACPRKSDKPPRCLPPAEGHSLPPLLKGTRRPMACP
jgi:hypothetical protein